MRASPKTVRRLWLAALVCLALGATACGIPTGPPQAIPPDQVPAQLLSPNSPTTSTTVPSAGVPFSVYLLNASNQVAPYQRTVGVHAASLTVFLDVLVAGPSLNEALAGVTTAIPGGTRVLSVSGPANNVVTVNFSSDFAVSGSAQVEAVAQVVYTIDNSPPPKPAPIGVLFEIEGAPIPVPTGSGSETTAPVTVANYPGMVAG